MGGCHLPSAVRAIQASPQAHAPSEDRNHHRLDKDLADDAPAARSNRQTDGYLAGAVRRARSEQAAEIGAGRQQHDAGQCHNPSQKTARRPAEKVADQTRSGQLELQPIFLRRVLPTNASGNRIQFGLHLGQADPVLDAHDREDHLLAPRLKPVDPVQRCFIRHRNEDVGLQELFRPVEAFRGNAYDGVHMLVDTDRLSHDVGVRAKIILPCRVGKHGDFRGPRMLVIGALKQTSKQRLDGDDLEVLPAYFVSPDRPGDTVGFQAKKLYRVSGHGRKYRVAIAHIAHFRIGENRIVSHVGCERHHPVWIGHIQGLQDHCLQHAENDHIGGDPERQDEDGREGKAGRTAHLAKG